MDKLFTDFTIPTYQDWVEQLHKDLKGKSETLLQTDDPIEGFSFTAYQHQHSHSTTPPQAFQYAHIRNTHRENNAWENMATIIVKDEHEANQRAIELLNIGITALRFELQKNVVNWQTLLKEIQLQYIQTTFKLPTPLLYFSAIEQIPSEASQTVFFELEWMDIESNHWIEISRMIAQKPRYIFSANGYALQQCGCNTWQEVAYCLASAHELLVQLINNGISTDNATQSIHFNIGVGTNYFCEIAKIRALRVLWAKIIEEYQPQNTESLQTRITGITGFTNKSLKDPYTNLLRQTTEAMSLILSGVHAVCVQAYDTFSTNGATKLSTRMAANIPLILQEESYFDKVIDPLGGSYALEHLTHKIADLAWAEFQQIEKYGGIQNQNAVQQLKEKVQKTAHLRKQRIIEKIDTLIGVNEFPNPTQENNEWIPINDYLNMPALILEQTMLSDHE